MPEGDRERMGGTMRLGSRATVLRPGSRAFELYGGKGIDELEVRRGSSDTSRAIKFMMSWQAKALQHLAETDSR